MISYELRTVLHCKCELCGWEWDSFKRDPRTRKLISEKPERCAGCKYRRSWNGEDRRRKDFEPDDFDGKIPQVRPKDLLEALFESKTILEQLIHDYGPCNHPKECVCEETATLAKVNRQIETLTKLTGKKERNGLAKAV